MSRPRPKGRRLRTRHRQPFERRSIHVRDAVEFSCPFCGGNCSVSEEHEHVLHALPVCPKYTAMEPGDFLAAVNNAALKN